MTHPPHSNAPPPSGGGARLKDESGHLSFKVLVESLRDYAVFLLDRQGIVQTWNPGAEAIKGYAPAEIIGRHFSVFYPPEDVAAGKPQRALMVAESEGRWEDEGWRLRKDGGRFWASAIITALRDESGALVGFGKVTRELTDRWLAEEALRESEHRFRLIVQSVRDYGIFMLDPEGRIASWNEGAQAIKGYRADEIIGRHFSTFYPEEDVAAGKPEMELREATATGRYEDEGWRVRKDGSLFWANVIISALRGDDGELIGFAKVTRDLTERRAGEQRAIADARRIAEVEASNRAKSEFLASMSHELRTPLNAIAGYVDIMMEGIHGTINPTQRDDLERIRRSQRHLLGIINDLLNFSRIEAGKLDYNIAPFDLDEVMDVVQPIIEPLAARKDIELHWPARGTRVFVLGDLQKVQQIALNLLTNAIKFTGRRGRISIACGTQADTVSISVKDTGIGIPAEKLEDVFEPFVQVGRSLTSPQEGSGLGLAISRDLARAMDGDLILRSKLGVGSTFVLTLPHAPAP